MGKDKKTVWISLDEDLAAELRASDDALASAVNEAVRSELSRRQMTAGPSESISPHPRS